MNMLQIFAIGTVKEKERNESENKCKDMQKKDFHVTLALQRMGLW